MAQSESAASASATPAPAEPRSAHLSEAHSRSPGKSLPTLVEELWELVTAYFRQETVEPLKGLGRFVAFGLAGSLLLGVGLVLLFLALLRALQEKTGSTFTGNLSWAPYGITLVGTLLVIGLAISRVGKGAKKGKDRGSR